MAKYVSNTGVGAPLEIYGLKGQYIIYAVASMVCMFLLAVVLSNTQIPVLLVILFVVVATSLILGGIIGLNKQFGLHGLMKLSAQRRMPKYIRFTRNLRTIIKVSYEEQVKRI